MCLNTERMVNMFSKELQIIDRNTVKYMIDELQEELNVANEALTSANENLSKKNAIISEKDAALLEKDATIAALTAELDDLKKKK